MACNTLANRLEPCKQYVGGIRGAFFVSFDYSTVVSKDVAGLVTSLNNGATPTPVNKTAYFWELKGLSTIETTVVASRDNGTNNYDTTFTLSFKPSGISPAAGDLDEETIKTLSQGRWQIIIWDRNNQFWLLGETEGCDANGGTLSWGVQMGDARLNTITFMSSEPNPPAIVDASTYSDMETVVAIAS